MRTKVLSTNPVVYPLDYDKNNKAGLHQWRAYIHNELKKSIRQDESLIIEAHKILTHDARYKTPTSYARKVKYDRIVYVLLFAVAIAIGLLSTLKF